MHAEQIMIAFGEEHYQLDGKFSSIVETSTDKRDGSFTKTKSLYSPIVYHRGSNQKKKPLSSF